MEEVPTPADVLTELSSLSFRSQPWSAQEGAKEATVIIDQIINLGQKVWTIIEKNKAIQDVSYHYANALPRGATVTDLEGFSDLTAQIVAYVREERLRNDRLRLTYTVVHRYGGSYNGAGKYLDGVTVLPSHVSTLWGFTTNLAVGNVGTVNVGTKTNPIASLVMELSFKVSTVLRVTEYHKVFEFRGDSPMVQSVVGR